MPGPATNAESTRLAPRTGSAPGPVSTIPPAGAWPGPDSLRRVEQLLAAAGLDVGGVRSRMRRPGTPRRRNRLRYEQDVPGMTPRPTHIDATASVRITVATSEAALQARQRWPR